MADELAPWLQPQASDLAPWLQNKPQEQPIALSDVPGQAWANAPQSALNLGKAVVEPFLHPSDTIENLGRMGVGFMQKAGIPTGGEDRTAYANAAVKHFKDRYGGWENVKKTMATDPAGFLADVSVPFTGGETALARLPGIAGKVGEVAGTVGRYTDPINLAAQAAKGVTRGVGEVGAHISGLYSGVGPEAVRTAFRSGLEGGQAGQAFRENMRGNAPMDEVVTDAQNAVRNMRAKRGGEYKMGMAQVAQSTTPIPFTAIDQALHDAQLIKTYKGQNISPATEKAAIDLQEAVKGWRFLDSAEYHTAEGIDALKQKVGDIRDSTAYGTPERVVADKVYGAIRGAIINQAPEYAKTMKAYEQATKQIKAMDKELSLNPNANVDTALRKLQSVLRNNVNTSYGRRAQLADFIVSNGAPNLVNKLAGQAMNTWTPRGLGALSAQLGGELVLSLLGHASAGSMGAAGLAALPLPLMSPRLVGETAHKLGQVSRPVPSVSSAVPYARGARGITEYGTNPPIAVPPINVSGQMKRGGRVARTFRCQ